ASVKAGAHHLARATVEQLQRWAVDVAQYAGVRRPTQPGRQPLIARGAGDREHDPVQPLHRRQRSRLVLARFDPSDLKHEIALEPELRQPAYWSHLTFDLLAAAQRHDENAVRRQAVQLNEVVPC